jgi:NAD(P)-dependent dehydrogenase (short-subunit alcohol dehydrogenase family)
VAVFRNAFVTGASSGIGKAISLRLAERGTRVILAARRRAELDALAREIRASGKTADVEVLDVSDADAAAEAVLRWDRELGGLDLVLANAGMNEPRRVRELDWKSVERVMRVNTLGALATLVAAIGPMLERRRGTLAAVTSLAAMRGLPGHPAYSASKAAVSTFLESLRTDLSPHGLRVVDIRPGFVDTPMTEKNRFPMPFLMESMYPWQLSVAMSFAQSMPDVLWRNVAQKLPR